MPSAFKVGDRMAMLNDGRIVFHGTVDQVRATDHAAVRQFIEGRAEGPLGMF
jgi:phospholipid/cholesterol/gamma-HCH transport system ATP-binding protein